MSNKRKIINDPLYGFITIPTEFIYDIISHPWFQRLRRIRQLGMSDLVYPGALHTRFHHALGAMHLMDKSLSVLRKKGVDISNNEFEAANIAILLHDIGHGPFSHTLEYSLVKGVHHEEISLAFMRGLNKIHNGKLNLAIEIFTNSYKRNFFHQLISGQVDVDRLDYLRRDSFYTGVSEGVVGVERIINMFNVVDNQLVVEEKGIYSIEKFLISRRLMYWQVYMHKTVVSAETLLKSVLTKVKTHLPIEQKQISVALRYFLNNTHSVKDFSNIETLNMYSALDDADIISAIKHWSNQTEDEVLAYLSENILNRRLPKIQFSKIEYTDDELKIAEKSLANVATYHKNELNYFMQKGKVTNNTYSINEGKEPIKVLLKNGAVKGFNEVSDNYNSVTLTEKSERYYLAISR